jgi:hypothetical protein
MKYTEIFNEDLGDDEQRRVAVVGEAFGGGPCDELQLQVQDGNSESFIDMNFEEVKALRDKLSEWLIEKDMKVILYGTELIATERKRQIEELGFDYTNDALYANEELARAGAWYSLPTFDRMKFESLQIKNQDKKSVINIWPWDRRYYKPSPESRIRELSKAGALIAAQIDYLLNIKK